MGDVIHQRSAARDIPLFPCRDDVIELSMHSTGSMMKVLWFSVVLAFTVMAQSIISETCDITLNRETTVTQFCLSSLERRFSTKGKLNFTLNGSVLLFTPLPGNRQVEIKIHDNSDGLEAWANLANAFVDSVASESLPYEGK